MQEEADTRSLWASALENAGYVVHPLENIEALFEALLEIREWRAIVVDLGFRGSGAMEFLDRLRTDGNVIPVLLTAWERSLPGSRPALVYPRLAFIQAPLDPRVLGPAVRALPPPPKPRVEPSGFFFRHTYEGVQRDEREQESLLPETLIARANAEAAEARASLPHETRSAREAHRRRFSRNIPQPNGFEIASRYMPADREGGDYHDVTALPDGTIAMLVAKAHGGGSLGESEFAMARNTFHSLAAGSADARRIVIRAADRIAHELPCGAFFSLVFALLDPSSGFVSVVNAGHLPPLHWSLDRGSPVVSSLQVAGASIGLVKGSLFERTLLDCHLILQPGEQLVFLSEGVETSTNRKNEEYGEKRVYEAMKLNGGTTAEELAEGIVNSVLYYRRDAPTSDDITVLAVRRNLAS